ncbi:MAG: hypothetical protein SFZ24_08775 [Planctomycetota bacterium]|nr:hypothetical protein [Planctomycetota bacterium]
MNRIKHAAVWASVASAGWIAGTSSGAADAAAGEPAADWRELEAGALTGHVQLTFPEQFARAGEAYFSPDGAWVIFQAIPAAAAGEAPATVYAMYVARLQRDERGAPTGLTGVMEVSPPGSANTCGFFHPTERGRIIFGSTLTAPASKAPAGYQRGTSTYAWQFPTEMEVVTRMVVQVATGGAQLTEELLLPQGATDPTPLWRRDGYDAECSYSVDGRFIVYTRVDPETLDPDLYVFDTKEGVHTPLVTEGGYDGGPFFSPDGRWICYRSDRAGDDNLQLFVAELEVDEDTGAIRGVARERQLTENGHVNWAPFWHPGGSFLVYTTSEQGHANYEVYAIDARGEAKTPRTKRLTHAPGFDGLPAFDARGEWMMWTSQRGGKRAGEERASSQLWVARVVNAEP